MLNTEELIEKLNSPVIRQGEFNDKPCWIIDGWHRIYAVDKETHNVYDYEKGKYISIVDCQTGSHTLTEAFPIILALINDHITGRYIPTLKQKND